jgi:hypothetical protein
MFKLKTISPEFDLCFLDDDESDFLPDSKQADFDFLASKLDFDFFLSSLF